MSYIKEGDCLELMKEIPDNSIDMILCDPPYGTTARNEWDEIIPFDKMWENYHRIAKPNAAICLFCQIPFSVKLGMSNYKELKYEWIWEKSMATGFLNANKSPLKAHEQVLVFYKTPPLYNPQFGKGKKYTETRKCNSTNYRGCKITTTENDGRRYPKDVLYYPIEHGLHPTQKPTALLEYLIKTYTNPGMTVLDNCMGSGSTCIAAIRTGREYIGFEKDPTYFKIASERIAKTEYKFKGQKTLLDY